MANQDTTIPTPDTGEGPSSPDGSDAPAQDTPGGPAASGIPDNPDGYEIARPSLPEGLTYDDALETAMREQAHALGLSDRQLQGLVTCFADYQSAVHQGLVQETDQARAVLEQDLRTEWGRQFDGNLDLARRASRALAPDDDTLEALQGALGDARVIKLFHRIGSLMGEDQTLGDQEGARGFSAAGAQAEIRRLETNIAGLLGKEDSGSRRERLTLEEQRRHLLAQAFPD